MRRIIFAAYLLVLAFAVCAFGDVQVYSDTDSLGVVPSLMEGSRLFVSAEDVGKIFGFTARKNGEQLLLTKGNSQLRFMLNSAAAWRGTSIVPLYAAPFERNGKIWLDSQSAASIFQTFAGKSQNNKLRFSDATLASTQPKRTVPAASVRPAQPKVDSVPVRRITVLRPGEVQPETPTPPAIEQQRPAGSAEA